MSARNTHKRTSSDASLDSEVGDDENKRNKKKCASRVKLVITEFCVCSPSSVVMVGRCNAFSPNILQSITSHAHSISDLGRPQSIFSSCSSRILLFILLAAQILRSICLYVIISKTVILWQ